MLCSTQEALGKMRLNLRSLECNPDVNTRQQLGGQLRNPAARKIAHGIQTNDGTASRTDSQMEAMEAASAVVVFGLLSLLSGASLQAWAVGKGAHAITSH